METSEILKEVLRIKKVNRAQDRQKDFKIRWGEKVRREERLNLGREKGEECWLIHEMKKIEKQEQKKEEIFEICYNMIIKKQGEIERDRKLKQERFEKIEIKREKQRKLNKKQCWEIIGEVVEKITKGIEVQGEQVEKEIEKILRKRKRSGESKYILKERKEKSYPERKPMIKARRRKMEQGELQEGGPKEGEIQPRGGKGNDDHELVGRMGTPEKMIKGNPSDKPPFKYCAHRSTQEP